MPTSQASEATSRIEPIVLTDIILYSPDGKPLIRHDKVSLDGEAVRNDGGTYVMKTQKGWKEYYADRNDGRELPSLPLMYAIIERLYEQRNPLIGKIIAEIIDTSGLCTSTTIKYAAGTTQRSRITHEQGRIFYGTQCIIPQGGYSLTDNKKEEEWETTLQGLLMPKNLDKAIEVLDSSFRCKSRMLVLNAELRKEYSKRAVWLTYSDGLNLYCDLRPDFYFGRSRGVKIE